MSRTPKLIFIAVGGFVAVLILAMVLGVIFGGNAKRQVQAFASDALGMEVSVLGALDIGFFPSLHVAMQDVHVRNGGSELATAAHVNLGLELFALLRNEVRIDKVELKQVKISIERQRDGKLNFEMAPQANAALVPARVATVSLSETCSSRTSASHEPAATLLPVW